MNGTPLKVVQEIAGHEDIRTTMKYAHLLPGYSQDAVNKIGEQLNVKKSLKCPNSVKQSIAKTVVNSTMRP